MIVGFFWISTFVKPFLLAHASGLLNFDFIRVLKDIANQQHLYIDLKGDFGDGPAFARRVPWGILSCH